jgi:hypothetical protein
VPLDRPDLHRAEDGLNAAARRLLIRPIGATPQQILTWFVHGEALVDEVELDRKLNRAYARPNGEGWLGDADLILQGEAARRRITASSEGSDNPVVEAARQIAWDLLVAEHGAFARLRALPPAEFLTALEHALENAMSYDRVPSICVQIEEVMRKRLLPYTINRGGKISWVGEPGVREQAIDPALSALAEPSLVTARAEFEKALVHLRRGELKDAGRWAGDAVETTMAVLLENHGHPQPQTRHGTDLVQAIKLFDQLKSTRVGVLNQDRDHALIFAPIKVRNACGHGGGAQPTPPDPAYVEAGVAAAAIAITYLASKFK